MPDDAPAKWGYTFPYLHDESQSVATAYRAACTPDFYLFDAEQELVYRGQLDDSRPSNNIPIDGRDLRAALDAERTPSIGCSIKWTAGNVPEDC